MQAIIKIQDLQGFEYSFSVQLTEIQQGVFSLPSDFSEILENRKFNRISLGEGIKIHAKKYLSVFFLGSWNCAKIENNSEIHFY